MTWSAAQYVLFEDERTRPARDLLSAVTNQPVRTAVDLGCGPGNSTEVLAARFPKAEITGLDSSPDMIEAARKRLPGFRFEVDAVEEWNPLAAPDVILSNAVLQWIPDHSDVLPRLMDRLAPGGTLAVQMPDNLASRRSSSCARLRRTGSGRRGWPERQAPERRSKAQFGTTACCGRIARL